MVFILLMFVLCRLPYCVLLYEFVIYEKRDWFFFMVDTGWHWFVVIWIRSINKHKNGSVRWNRQIRSKKIFEKKVKLKKIMLNESLISTICVQQVYRNIRGNDKDDTKKKKRASQTIRRPESRTFFPSKHQTNRKRNALHIRINSSCIDLFYG